MAWFRATQASIANGASVVTVDSGEDISNIKAGDALIVGSFAPVEIKRAYIDGSDNKLIELVIAWGDSTQTTVPARVVPTAGDFNNAVTVLNNATVVTQDNFKTMDDWGSQPTGNVTFTAADGVTYSVRSMQQMDADVQSAVDNADALTGSILAPSKADFFALAEKRIRDNAGSGFAEWGKQHTSTPNVNEGLWEDASNAANADKLFIGRDGGLVAGISRKNYPIVSTNGISSYITDGLLGRSTLLFPPAPDGTKTYDSATGAVVQHIDSATAFAAETATNKVVTSRQDFVFLESWHEKISDKDVVYPLGNVQYGATTWEGIALSNTVVAQGYSAFGEWDTVTKGYGVVWSTLSDANKAQFVQDSENNIYSDDGKLIQVRYRVRVVEGLGDLWDWGNPATTSVSPVGHPQPNTSFAYDSTLGFVKAQASSALALDYNAPIGAGFAYFVGNRHSNKEAIFNDVNDEGLFSLSDAGQITNIAHNGLCFAVPIALVQRRNQGAYHPVHNPEGCSKFLPNDFWYNTAQVISSRADCFDPTKVYVADSGFIATGSSGRSDGKFYDAIYASDVDDLRMSSKRLPHKEIHDEGLRKAKAKKQRGFEGVPFTKLYEQLNTTIAAGATVALKFNTSIATKRVGDPIAVLAQDGITWQPCRVLTVNANNTDIVAIHADEVTLVSRYQGVGAMLYFEYQLHSQTNLTWTDIISDDLARIAATFPDGVEGQVVFETSILTPVDTRAYDASRENISPVANSGLKVEITNNDGATWDELPFQHSNVQVAAGNAYYLKDVNNIIIVDESYTTQVLLVHYETQAHFTQDDVASEVLDSDGFVFATESHLDALLVSSLKGIISTGVANSEELSVTKVVNDVITHTAETIIADLLMNTYLSSENSIAKLMFNVDDSGVIDGTNQQSFNTQYFVIEE